VRAAERIGYVRRKDPCDERKTTAQEKGQLSNRKSCKKSSVTTSGAATLFFVQSQNDNNGSSVSAVTPSVTAQFRRSRRNEGVDCKCGQACWVLKTAAGTTMYKCQGCGKVWMEGCTHKREIQYVTKGGGRHAPLYYVRQASQASYSKR
jgi:hypothetical protein